MREFPPTSADQGKAHMGSLSLAEETLLTPLSISSTLPTGYHVATGEPLLMVVELMNQASWQQHTVVTIDFEYIPGLPADFYQTRPIWLDIAGCHIASDMPAKANTSFEYSLWPPYQSNYTGAIIGMGGMLCFPTRLYPHI